jgi:hypothetical protein
MSCHNRSGRSVVSIATRLRAPSLAFCTAALAACGAFDDLLEVEAPGQIVSETLNQPRYARLLVESVVADFECAFGGYIVAAGTFGEELGEMTNNAPYWLVERREVGVDGGALAVTTCEGATLPGILKPLQIARFQGDDVAKKLEVWTDAEVANRQSLLATAYAYAGYAALLLGETYCSMAFDLGPELTRAQVFGEAETRFTKALSAAQAAANAEITNLALVGRARARLNLAVVDGMVVNGATLAAAAADARQVPAGFVKDATFADTPPRRNNNVFSSNNFLRLMTVAERFWNVTHQGVADPRVRVVNTGVRGQDGSTINWVQNKYTSLATRIPIARWAEAQLIIAEAELATGNLAAAVGIINSLHSAAGLPAYSGGTAAEIRDHLIEERRLELFLEGQHLGDKLRYNLTFQPSPGSPYLSKGGTYAPTRCLPLPVQETQNNPNINR